MRRVLQYSRELHTEYGQQLPAKSLQGLTSLSSLGLLQLSNGELSACETSTL